MLLNSYQKNCRNFKPKIVTKLTEMVWVGSGVQKEFIPDPASRGQKSTGSRIPDTTALNETRELKHRLP
jgi:hypothetical protein